MSQRFFIAGELKPGLVVLQGAEAHHLARVSRLSLGDQVCLFNGDGLEYPAEVVSLGRRAVELSVRAGQAADRELGFRLEVAAPLPKGDRGQFLIEKLTELGATVFVPLRTERSVLQPAEARLEKLSRYVIEASKQCGRNVLMRIEPMADWSAFCARAELPERKWLALPGGGSLPAAGKSHSVLAVGPEGGWTEDELTLAERHGWQAIDLGKRTLRVETAALALTAKLALAECQ